MLLLCSCAYDVILRRILIDLPRVHKKMSIVSLLPFTFDFESILS